MIFRQLEISLDLDHRSDLPGCTNDFDERKKSASDSGWENPMPALHSQIKPHKTSMRQASHQDIPNAEMPISRW
jgi:hypothetical protein